MNEAASTAQPAQPQLKPPQGLIWRPVVVDGLNYLFHGRGDDWLSKYQGGSDLLKLIQTLAQLGCFDIRIVLTSSVLDRILGWRSAEANLTRWLLAHGYLVIAPSRRVESLARLNDDLVVYETALACGGVVLSKDQFRDHKAYASTRDKLWQFKEYMSKSQLHALKDQNGGVTLQPGRTTTPADLWTTSAGSGGLW